MNKRYTSPGLPSRYPTKGRFPNLIPDAQARRAIRVVRDSGVVPILEPLLAKHPGRRSALTVEPILVAVVLTAETLSSYNRTEVCRTLAGLSRTIRSELGLPTDEPISYSTVSKQQLRLERFLKEASTVDGVKVSFPWLIDHLLASSVPEHVLARLREIVLDATAFPTWARTYEFTPQADIDPDRPPPGVRVGEDGKILRCADTAARAGWRTGTSYYPAGSFTGSFITIAVAARSGRWTGNPEQFYPGDPEPAYILGLSVDPASDNPGPIGAALARTVRDRYANVGVVKADPGYTDKYPTFVRPLHEDGFTTVSKPSKAEIRQVRTVFLEDQGIVLLEHCGTFLPPWTPKRTEDTKGWRRPPAELTGSELTDWYTERAKLLRYSVVDRYKDGSIRIRCPQCSGRVNTNARTRNRSAAVRRKLERLPVSFHIETESGFCCDGTVKIRPEQLDRYQRTPYGTWAWHADYNGRNQVENVNSMLKGNGGLEKRSCRPFGLAAHTIAALAHAVVHNMQLAARPDPTRTPEHSPHITEATVEQSPLPAEHNPNQHSRGPPQAD